MRLALLALAFAAALSAQTICGRRTAEAEVYCVPDMRPFGAMLPGPQVQLWIRYDHPLSQTFFVRLHYRVLGTFTQHLYRLAEGRDGLAATSFVVDTLQPIQIDYWDVDRWEWRVITP